MKKGLTAWRDADKRTVVLDADNVFWAVDDQDFNASEIKISRDVISLYEKVKDTLDKKIEDFRFSQELSAIYIDPTDKCNANCPYCYIPAPIRKKGRSMTKDELGFILKKIDKYFHKSKRKPVIIFHASEPLIVKDILFWAIKNFSDKFYFGLQTNATLLEKKDVEFLKKYGVGVGISLDSSERSLNNRLRATTKGNGNFNSAVRAIEWFGGYTGLNVICTVTKNNVTGMPALVKFLHKKGVGCVLLNPMRLTQKTSRAHKPDEKLLTKYFIKAVDTAISLSKNTNRKIIIGNFSNIILGIIAPEARRLMCDISPCGGGRCFFTITASGEMIPCGEFIGLKGFSGGNIFHTGISQAMQSKPFDTIRSRFVEKVKECNTCRLRNICGSPCPAELYSLGTFYKKAVFCEFYKQIIAYAFKLIGQGQEKHLLRSDGLKNLDYVYDLKKSLRGA